MIGILIKGEVYCVPSKRPEGERQHPGTPEEQSDTARVTRHMAPLVEF